MSMFTYKACENVSYFPRVGFLPQTFDECCIAGDNPLGRPNVFTQKKGKFFSGTSTTCDTHWLPVYSSEDIDGDGYIDRIIIEKDVSNYFTPFVTLGGYINLNPSIPDQMGGVPCPVAPTAVTVVGGMTKVDFLRNPFITTGPISTVAWSNPTQLTTYTYPIDPGCLLDWGSTYIYFTNTFQQYQDFNNQMSSNGGVVYITGSAGNNGTYSATTWSWSAGQTEIRIQPAVPTTSVPPITPITGVCDGNINWDA